MFLSVVFLVCILTDAYWPSQCKDIHEEKVISNLLPPYTTVLWNTKDNDKECWCVSSMLKACILTATKNLVKGYF